jgi:hypothetical protein
LFGESGELWTGAGLVQATVHDGVHPVPLPPPLRASAVVISAIEMSAAGQDAIPGLRRLRHRVEMGPPGGLAGAAADALAVADRLCWDSLARGDIPAFTRQSQVSAELRQFGICARLLADN